MKRILFLPLLELGWPCCLYVSANFLSYFDVEPITIKSTGAEKTEEF